MLPNGLEESFLRHNQSDKFTEIKETYELLASRTEEALKAFRGEDYGEPNRIRSNGLVYRQVLLHRSIYLFEGSVKAAVDENVYSMTLNVRGHFETTASLGYFTTDSSRRREAVSALKRLIGICVFSCLGYVMRASRRPPIQRTFSCNWSTQISQSAVQ
jgi:hypothetical protein